MVHGWYQSPFPTHMLKCPQSDERDHTTRPSATERGGQLPGGVSWASTNRPTASSASQLQTSASPFGRLGLCALTIWAAEYFARAGERSTIALKAELARWMPKGERLLIAMRKEVMGMMKPMTKKILLGAPAVALSAALACTMVACSGGGGEQSESGGDAAASKSAYESQKIEVEGFTVESLADGTYYRGEFYGTARTCGWT